MPTFGKARLYRSDIGLTHKLQFRVCGVGDPGHFLRSRYFRKFVRGLRPKSVLDAGSGGGDYSFWMAERWPEATIESVDICEEFVVRNRQLQEALGIENIRFVTMDLVELPKEARYDLIVSIDSLEHIVEQEKVLNNFYSALRPGGWLYLHIPLVRPRDEPLKRHLTEFHKWVEDEHVGEERSVDDMRRMLLNCGFVLGRMQLTFKYYFGELACSLSAMFFRDTMRNRVAQGLLVPLTRLLCYGDLAMRSREGFALAVLAQRPGGRDGA